MNQELKLKMHSIYGKLLIERKLMEACNQVKNSKDCRGKGKLPYVEDGVESRTTGQNTGIESLSINFENPDGDMRIAYHAHIKNVVWTPSWAYNGTEIGSGGQGNTIEAVRIMLENVPTSYHVQYQVHIQGLGWQASNKDGEVAGSVGQGRAIYDTGAPLKHRDYHYHVDAPTKGYKHVRFLPGDKLPDIFK